MSETKHTPGPWSVDPTNRFDIRDSDGALVADVDTSLRYDSRPTYEMEANGRLVAAAPELLEALKVSFQIGAAAGAFVGRNVEYARIALLIRTAEGR